METIDLALESLRMLLSEAAAFLPRVLLAVAIAIAGWLLAKAARFTVVKALRSINFHVMTERARIDAFLQMGGSTADTTALLGTLVYWLVIVAALIMACNSLDLSYVSELLSRIALFVPRVILAVVILAGGAYFAYFIDGSVTIYGRNVGFDEAPLLGRLARYAVMLFVVLIALEQLGIAGDIIRESFLIILAGIVLALALAFGLGGRQWAANLLERWWPQQKKREPGND
ncbi:mechanosensitive ion channel family protein [Dechloromonas sp. A34]|uniref:mechanosensitive ion channel family protein n=1 Tax=Dechloromonas sp. A34 TaxID=447588 RepID=UPI0022499F0F|nr:hypothetical protein [Dechloromonas sp. A34]